MLSYLSRLVVLIVFAGVVVSAQSLTIASGNGQILFEQFQSQPFAVQVADAAGHPLSGVTVNFTLTQGLGRVQTPTATTDASGMASTMVVTTSLQPFQSFASETLNAASSQGSVNFRFTTISSSGVTGPAQPGTFLLAPTSDPPVLTGTSGSTLPGAIQIGITAGSGAQQGQPIPNVGIQTATFDTFALPGTCAGPGGIALTDAKGVATCDLVIAAAPGTYEFQVSIGSLFLYRVFTLIVTAPSSCVYSLTSSSQSVASSASSGSVSVLTAAGCAWTATSNVPWITITSGAPGTGPGTAAFAIASNATGASRSGSLTIAGKTFTVTQSASSAPGLSIATGGTLPAATQNSPYSTMLQATGGTLPYTWSSSGTLPPGLAISPAGVISGTPTAAGTFPFSVIVTDAGGGTSLGSFSLTVNSAGAQTFSFLTASFPDAILGQAYNQEVKVAGGCISPFHPGATILATGIFPPGLGLQYSGTQTFVAGTPTFAGNYNISLNATDACGVTITRAFTIAADASAPPPAQFAATPVSLSFSYATGSAQPANQNISLTSSSPGAAFTAAVTAGANWLGIVSGLSGNTPATVTIGIANFSTLTPGTYMGAVTITPVNSGTQLQIPVTLSVTSTPLVVATPTALAFNLTTGGAKSSAQQSISVASSGASLHFTTAASTTTGTGWLSVTPTGGDTPASLTVTANASSLIAGSYTGSVAIVPSAGPIVSVPVTLTVTGGPMLAVNPPSLTFDVQSGLTPTPQTLSLTSGPPVGFNISISPAAASNWLSVTTFTALTPASLNVAVNPTGLTPGAYNATVTISDPSNSSPPVTVPVTVNVVASPIVAAVTNGASFQAGPVAPGELLVLFGSNMGPSALVPTGAPLGFSLAGTSVLFDGSPGVLLYTSAQQVAVIAPVALAGRASTQIQVQYQSRLSLSVNVRVVDASPGIFMADTTGQGAILNQDGSPNSAGSPAVNGSVVSIYATGGGQTNPPMVDGAGSSGPAPLLLPTSAQVDGIPAEVTYKGAAPGLAGVNQINVRLPPGVRTGVPVPVLLTVGTVAAPQVTLYVQAP